MVRTKSLFNQSNLVRLRTNHWRFILYAIGIIYFLSCSLKKENICFIYFPPSKFTANCTDAKKVGQKLQTSSPGLKIESTFDPLHCEVSDMNYAFVATAFGEYRVNCHLVYPNTPVARMNIYLQSLSGSEDHHFLWVKHHRWKCLRVTKITSGRYNPRWKRKGNWSHPNWLKTKCKNGARELIIRAILSIINYL